MINDIIETLQKISKVVEIVISGSKIKEKIIADHHFSELLKGSSIAFIIRGLGFIFGYIFTLIITRGYGAEAMGIFALSFTVLQITSVIGRLGLDTAFLRFVAENSSQKKWNVIDEIYNKILKILVPFSIVLFLLIYSFSTFIAEVLFKKSYLTYYFKIASVGIPPFVLLYLHTEGLRGLKKIKEYLLLQQAGIFILSTFLLGVTTILSALKLIDLFNIYKTSLPLIVFIGSISLITGLSYIIWKKNLKKRVSNGNNFAEQKVRYSYILSVSIPLLLTTSLSFVISWTDTIMLGIYRTEVDVGIYTVAVKLSAITSIMLFAVNSIAAPKFAELYGRRDLIGLQRVAKQATKIIFWSSMPGLCLLFFFPGVMLKIFGDNFVSGTTALIVLTFGQLINVICGSVGIVLQMSGKQTVLQNLTIVATIMNIFLNLLLIPEYGFNGAAFASMASMVFLNIGCLIAIKRYYGFYTIYLPGFHKLLN